MPRKNKHPKRVPQHNHTPRWTCSNKKTQIICMHVCVCVGLSWCCWVACPPNDRGKQNETGAHQYVPTGRPSKNFHIASSCQQCEVLLPQTFLFASFHRYIALKLTNASRAMHVTSGWLPARLFPSGSIIFSRGIPAPSAETEQVSHSAARQMSTLPSASSSTINSGFLSL